MSVRPYLQRQPVGRIVGALLFTFEAPGEPDCTYADTKRIKEVLGWKAKVGLEEGVKQMLAHIDYWRDAPVWNVESIQEATRDWFAFSAERLILEGL